ncbi:MAG TPA: uridine phosphorylase [Deltaproteobacteria bacterium]|nr:uridine phosphorylase [Deltaproteobacteria bacterium]
MRLAHHLEIEPEHLEGNQGIGRYVLLPGSVGRVARISARLSGVQVIENRRRLDVHLGTLRHEGGTIDVAVLPTGMGCPSVDIVVNELIALGARRLLRVGTAGGLQPQLAIGDLVIATGAVRDESTSDVYAPRGFPAVADPWLVHALCRAADQLGLADRVHCGLLHSKDSFYGREFGRGPDAERNHTYMARLAGMGVLATEMEAAHLFVLGAALSDGPTTVAQLRSHTPSIRAGAVCAIIGTPASGIAALAEEQEAEERLIELALSALIELWRQESP